MLIIEDGQGLEDAESFATAESLVMYAGKFGRTIPATEAEREALLRRAAVQMMALKWKGCKSSSAQALPWPRRGAQVDGEFLSPSLIPARIEYGQMALAVEIYADDIDPPSQRTGAVVKERVEGAVEVQYAEVSSNSGYLLPAAPDRPSATQFADYLARRGLFAIRA
ncbi:hypothetical protein JFT67_05520 [Pseudomonas simiae]|uniref:DnaT-like ssDNA-binding protein n=1 Tax=Pseudomonas simiae TaxID=321846 RepID=UPI0018E7F329|nr:DnaT-like ssDNA-binding protein [Pseudomonas simiae]MBJ2228499.1 hypothetical protein [Pseudomonas simiae]